MSTLVIALDGGKTLTHPDSDTLARLAYEAHRTECRECRRGESECPTGTARHNATTTPTDYPSYPEV